jgi:hypothetical protein
MQPIALSLPKHIQVDAGRAGARVRTCCRCERIADQARKRGYPAPPVVQAHSRLVEGVRYWSGLCMSCGAWEQEQREALRTRVRSV